jgi:hypothetical protein
MEAASPGGTQWSPGIQRTAGCNLVRSETLVAAKDKDLKIEVFSW